MNNKILLSLAFIGLFIIFAGTPTKVNAACTDEQVAAGQCTAEEAKTEKKIVVCIPEGERGYFQKMKDKISKEQGTLSKVDQACADEEKEKLVAKIRILEADAMTAITCTTVETNQVFAKKAKLFQGPNEGTKVILEANKGDKVILVAHIEVNDQKDWVLVMTNKCQQGFVKEKYIKQKFKTTKTNVVPPDKLVVITDPEWANKKENLIKVDAEGIMSLEGAVDGKKVDQIIVNGENVEIDSDDRFSKPFKITDKGKQIRIIAKKNGKKVDSLEFKIQVGN